MPIIGFKKGKSLRDILVRAKVKSEDQNSSCGKCNSKRCGVCKYIECCETFSNKDDTVKYNIKGGQLNCNSSNVVYLLECKTCKVQYVGSTSTKVRLRFNNYMNANRNFLNGRTVPQHSLHSHFNSPDHNSHDDWKFKLIDSADNVNGLRRSERYWQYTLNTFSPKGLNEREVNYDIT